ncbi:MAG: hypothetical protein ABI114_08965 [Rhodanobacter sp.]
MKTQLASRFTTRALADNRVVSAITKTPYWTAIAAALLTSTTLAILTVGGANATATPEQINGISVVDLPAVEVYAEAAASQGLSIVTLATVHVFADVRQGDAVDGTLADNLVHHSLAPPLQKIGSAGIAEGLSLFNSQLAMPYYSFGIGPSNISKE